MAKEPRAIPITRVSCNYPASQPVCIYIFFYRRRINGNFRYRSLDTGFQSGHQIYKHFVIRAIRCRNSWTKQQQTTYKRPWEFIIIDLTLVSVPPRETYGKYLLFGCLSEIEDNYRRKMNRESESERQKERKKVVCEIIICFFLLRVNTLSFFSVHR